MFKILFNTLRGSVAYPDVYLEKLEITDAVRDGFRQYETDLVQVFEDDREIYRGGDSIMAFDRFLMRGRLDHKGVGEGDAGLPFNADE